MDRREPVHSDRDSADLARFGYKQELKRTLGVFSSFAVAFSYISPSTGIFTLYFLALGALGGVMWWSWPIVIGGQFLIALNWAELSSHYPIAGSVYQWTKYLSGRTYAWFTGWIYLFAGVITVAAVVATLPLALIPVLNSVFNVHLNNTLGSSDQRVVALITLVIITVLNIYGVRLVALINNAGVVFEILGMVIFAVFLAALHNHQGVGVIFKTGGAKITPSTFLVGMFMSLFVVYGFDTASTLAEETRDPRREAPKAVLASITGAFIIGAFFLWGTLMAIPDLKKAVTGLFGPQTIIESQLNSALATTYLVVVAAAIFICCLAIMTSTIRLCFGMARDDQLPVSRVLAKVNPRWHTPVGSCIAIGLLSAIPFIQFGGATIIAVSATAMIYLSYLLGNVAVLRARLKGWPRVSAPFKLGRWGKLVNFLGIAWGAGMLVNFFWPASTGSLRVYANPRPNQTDFLGTGKPLVDLFGLDWLNKIPIIWTVTAFIVIVGLIYYFVFQRNKPFTPVVPPEEVPDVRVSA
ncbi:MAG: amino acid permease [Actinobacteria bacterium]|nr:MAG: amino acid permease [Actinomycetota bacterium]